MSTDGPSSIELMRQHIDTLFVRDGAGRLERLNQWDGGTAPRFFLGRTREGHAWATRGDVPATVVAELAALVAAEPIEDDPAATPLHTEAYREVLERVGPVLTQWTGPAFRLPTAPQLEGGRLKGDRLEGGTVEITPANGGLLDELLADWLPDVGRRAPFVAALDGAGRAVAVCASARTSAAASEAGVETHPAHRRRGHGLRAVAHWGSLVSRSGATAMYSTSWDNGASIALATKLGCARYGVDFHLT